MPKPIAGVYGLEWVRVDSSNVKAVAHTGAPSNQLHIKFKNGGQGYYIGVPRAVYHRILAAASKGKFVWRVLRGNGGDNVYGYVKLR